MDKKRQSILKQEGRIPLQEMVLPDFPDEDTGTVTITKSRRVSFGANFVKEFLVGSAVSAQLFSEYEQAVSSSDSSNPNSSRSGILDRTTFHNDDDDDNDALNLCVKPSNEDEYLHVRKKFCSENQNIYKDIHERNNEKNWEFNVSNASNIFTEKNIHSTNKSDSIKNTTKCNKKVSHLNDSIITQGKQLHAKRNDSDLNSSKFNESNNKSKQGKFSSTICFSADSPTADVEFTEGCISLAKSIFDKKKKDMTVYIQGKAKDNRREEKKDGGDVVLFESSKAEMSITKCVDDNSEEDSDSEMSKCFPTPSKMDLSDEFDESHENIENVPLHMYPLNVMLGQGDDSQDDAELERSLFFPERSLTEMLCSDPLKTSMNEDDLSAQKDNIEECDMEISSCDILKQCDESGVNEKNDESVEKEENGNSLRMSTIMNSPSPTEEGNKNTSVPEFSKVTLPSDSSLMDEDTTVPGVNDLATDPSKLSMCNEVAAVEESLEMSNCCTLNLSKCVDSPVKECEEEQNETPIQEGKPSALTSNAASSPDLNDSGMSSSSKLELSNDSLPVKENEELESSPAKSRDSDYSPLPEEEMETETDTKLPADPLEVTMCDEPSNDKSHLDMSKNLLLKASMPDEDCAATNEIRDESMEDLNPVKISFTEEDAMKPEAHDLAEVTEPRESPLMEDEDGNFVPSSPKVESQDCSVMEEDEIATDSELNPRQLQSYLSLSLKDDFDLNTSHCSLLKLSDTLLSHMEDETVEGVGNDDKEQSMDLFPTEENNMELEASHTKSKDCSSTQDDEKEVEVSESKETELENRVLTQMEGTDTEIADEPRMSDGFLKKNEEPKEQEVVINDTPEVSMEDASLTDAVKSANTVNASQMTYVLKRSEKSCLLDQTQMGQSFLNQSDCENKNRTSPGDEKIILLLTEQSGEPNCCWKLESFSCDDDRSWCFSFPLLTSSVVMKFKLIPPVDFSLLSFSTFSERSIELIQPKELQPKKNKIAVQFAFQKMMIYFKQENVGLDNVRKMPLFMDKMNLHVKKLTGILAQVIRITKEYPGSKLHESVLSFRLYSFPLMFSIAVSVNLTDPLRLSENCIAVKKHFGLFSETRVKSVFKDCLKNEEALVHFIRTLVDLVVAEESKNGFVTNRSHIRLIT